MEMDKLIKQIEKELKEVGEQGLTSANLDSTSKLVDMYKDLKESESGGQYGMMYREDYGRGGYNDGNWVARGDYNNRGYREGDYGRPYYDNYNRGYNGSNSRMRDHIDRIYEGAEMYDYGKERYQHGGSEGSMVEGLEKLMYAVCMLVESTMDFAQSPQEKEVIRKHVKKIRNI